MATVGMRVSARPRLADHAAGDADRFEGAMAGRGKSKLPQSRIFKNPRSGCMNFARSKLPEPVFPEVQLPEA